MINSGVFIMQNKINSVADKLRYYREASALSQQQVADALGVNRSTYTKYETAQSTPKLKTIVKIATIFNVAPELLLPENNSGAAPPKQMKDTATADSPIYQLSKDERGLIARYRSLDKDQKREIIEMISDLSKKAMLE